MSSYRTAFESPNLEALRHLQENWGGDNKHAKPKIVECPGCSAPLKTNSCNYCGWTEFKPKANDNGAKREVRNLIHAGLSNHHREETHPKNFTVGNPLASVEMDLITVEEYDQQSGLGVTALQGAKNLQKDFKPVWTPQSFESESTTKRMKARDYARNKKNEWDADFIATMIVVSTLVIIGIITAFL